MQVRHAQPHGIDPSRTSGNWPAIRFVGLFMLCIALLYGIAATRFFQEQFFPAWLGSNAQIASALLAMLGQPTQVNGSDLIGGNFVLAVRRGCDAMEPLFLYIAAVFAFPALWRSKIRALAIGVPALLALNQVRIVSLHFVGVHFPRVFEFVHVDLWQVLFIFLVVLVWALWATSAAKAQRKATR